MTVDDAIALGDVPVEAGLAVLAGAEAIRVIGVDATVPIIVDAIATLVDLPLARALDAGKGEISHSSGEVGATGESQISPRGTRAIPRAATVAGQRDRR